MLDSCRRVLLLLRRYKIGQQLLRGLSEAKTRDCKSGPISDSLSTNRRSNMENHQIVSREEWLVARKKHLAKEKEFTRLRDQLSRQRRELPWVKREG